MTKEELIRLHPGDYENSYRPGLMAGALLWIILGYIFFYTDLPSDDPLEKYSVGLTVMIISSVLIGSVVNMVYNNNRSSKYEQKMRDWEEVLDEDYIPNLPVIKLPVYQYELNDDGTANVVAMDDDEGEMFCVEDILFHDGADVYIETILVEGLSDCGIDDYYEELILYLPKKKS